MDFNLSEEEKLIQETARQFVNRELITREGAFLKQTELFLPPGDPPLRAIDAELFGQLNRTARRIGLWSLEVPETADGQPLTMVARVLIHREFGRSVLPFGPALIPSAISIGEARERLLAGTATLALAFDQLHATGVLDDITTRYRELPDAFVLIGPSLEVIQPEADLFLVPARGEASQHPALFLLDCETPGLSIHNETDLTSDARIGQLSFSQCRLPKDRVIGNEAEIAQLIAGEQLRLAARCLGIATRCLAATIEHTKNRVTFGRRLADRQAVQFKLADLSIDLQTATWQTLDAAWRSDNDLPYLHAAALAKKRTAKMAFEAADTAIQFHGGYGVCKEFPFESFYREARLIRLLYGREAEMNRLMGENFVRQEVTGTRQ